MVTVLCWTKRLLRVEQGAAMPNLAEAISSGAKGSRRGTIRAKSVIGINSFSGRESSELGATVPRTLF
jgi:hypothetical protein